MDRYLLGNPAVEVLAHALRWDPLTGGRYKWLLLPGHCSYVLSINSSLQSVSDLLKAMWSLNWNFKQWTKPVKAEAQVGTAGNHHSM